jgi:hypothetical protein
VDWAEDAPAQGIRVTETIEDIARPLAPASDRARAQKENA